MSSTMDTRLYQFLSVTVSPAYADEASRRIAARRMRDATEPVRRVRAVTTEHLYRHDYRHDRAA